MFSLFVHIFCSAVSFFAAKRFFAAWKRTGQLMHWDFGAFFALLSVGLAAPLLAFSQSATIRLLGAEGNVFFVLLSFAFVLRALVLFQGIRFVAPNAVMAVIAILALVRVGVGVYYPPAPELTPWLYYAHFSPQGLAISTTLLVVATFLMGMTLLANIKNLRERKGTVALLGAAFLTGGSSGFFTDNFNTPLPVFVGFSLLLLTFVLVLLFVLMLHKKGS